MYETIASPIEYGGIRLRNRIIFVSPQWDSNRRTIAKKSVKSPRVDVLW